MKLVYLETTKADLAWYRLYYGSVFPAGKRRAARQYLRAIANLLDNPRMGHLIDEHGTREYSIPRIPLLDHLPSRRGYYRDCPRMGSTGRSTQTRI
jgi:plasmid stabilization system protein ParE